MDSDTARIVPPDAGGQCRRQPPRPAACGWAARFGDEARAKTKPSSAAARVARDVHAAAATIEDFENRRSKRL
jgi:hypothetical protein